jgi:hypothetical protein
MSTLGGTTNPNALTSFLKTLQSSMQSNGPVGSVINTTA